MKSSWDTRLLLLGCLVLSLLQSSYTYINLKSGYGPFLFPGIAGGGTVGVHTFTSTGNMAGHIPKNAMRVYSSDIEDDLFNSLAEEFYSTTAIKDDFEAPKKINRQPRYEDEDCDIDVTEVDAHGDREISRYRKRKKTPRHNNFRKTEIGDSLKNPSMTELRYYIQQHFSKLCKLIIRDFQTAYIARFGKEGSKKGFLWRDIRTACYITQWSGEKKLEAKRVFIRNRMKDFLYSHEMNDELFWEVMDLEWEQYGAELILPPPTEEQLAKSNERLLKEGKEPLTMPETPPYPDLDRDDIIQRIFEIGREVRDFDLEDKIQEILELYEKTIEAVENDRLKIRRHDR